MICGNAPEASAKEGTNFCVLRTVLTRNSYSHVFGDEGHRLYPKSLFSAFFSPLLDSKPLMQGL